MPNTHRLVEIPGNHANERAALRARLQAGQTITLEEYKAMNPDNSPLTENTTTVVSHFKGSHSATGNEKTDRRNNTLTPGRTGKSGRVRSPGLST